MISTELVVYCLISGGVFLAALTVLLELAAKGLRVTRGMPDELMETTGFTWHLLNFLMEFLFFVVIPTLGYAVLFAILPLSGIRTGLASALFAFVLGAMPAIVGLSVRMKLAVPYLLFFLVGLLLKLSGSLAIIAYLYSL